MPRCMEAKAIELICELVKVQSMAQGQYRVTLDLPGHLADQAAWLMKQAGRTGVLFRVVVAEEEGTDDGEPQGNARKLHI